LDVCVSAGVSDERDALGGAAQTGAFEVMTTDEKKGIGSYLAVYIGLVCIAGIEVFLTYRGFSTHQLLAVLFVLAFVEAGIALAYFMHLKYERSSMVWTIVPAVIFVLLMMNQIWPDAYRLASLRLMSH
jgi:cytochrome c oxidase subunit 4